MAKKAYIGIPTALNVPTGKYRYASMTLPPLPEWDIETYPYAYISYSAMEGYNLRVFTAKLQYVLSNGKCTPISNATYLQATVWSKGAETWGAWTSAKSATANSTYLTSPVWGNTSIPYSDGSATLLTASEPVQVFEEKVVDVARNIQKAYVGVNGVTRNITTGYIGVNGVARRCFVSGTPIRKLPVGTSVYMNVNNVPTEFIVVHQGKPSTIYDSSCDGTWLLMKMIYEYRTFDSSNNDYANSDIHTYLNGAFLGLFDSGIQSAIKQAKIPYQKGTGSGGSVVSGSSGLSTKVFLLACCEVDDTLTGADFAPTDGACLSYFENATDSTRRAYMSGSTTATTWRLRSPRTNSDTLVKCVYTDGSTKDVSCDGNYAIRPALILSSTTLVDDQFNIIA